MEVDAFPGRLSEGGYGHEAAAGGGGGMDESVHGGNFFASMFRSESSQSIPQPSPDHEDFAGFTLPWEQVRDCRGRGTGGGLRGMGGRGVAHAG
jgi:hypothetical protein